MALNFPNGLLFNDPRTNSRLPLAKLSFFLSGTSTPATVYQDAALSVPWVQPINADVNGNFPPNIYLDPFAVSLAGKVKVQLANSLAVVQRTTDPYFIPFPITQDSACLQYLSAFFDMAIPVPQSGTVALVVNNLPGAIAINFVGGFSTVAGVSNPSWQINNATTGVQTATFTAVNKPGVANSAVTQWLPILFQGSTYYIPCFS